MKCHYIYDHEAGKVLIPGCMGSVIHGVNGCSCRAKEVRYDVEKLRELSQQVKELETENARLNRVIKNLIKSKG